MVKNILLKYTKENDIVLDQFLGSGTTAIEALLLNGKIIGIDINKKAIDISKGRVRELKGDCVIKLGDARKIDVHYNTVKLICTHPPYMDIIKYSNDIEGDIYRVGKKNYNY